MRVLITGVSGFAGSHLADYLLTRPGLELWGAALTTHRPDYLSPAVRLLAVDLRDPEAVQRLIQAVQPEQVYHLAGQAFVPQSRQDPWDTLETNLKPQVNLFQALSRERLRPRILIVSSYEVYAGLAPRKGPVDEAWPLGPDSPYGVSKVAQEFFARLYFEEHDLPVVRARPFNHIGPRQSTRFVAAAFASQVACIQAGVSPAVIKVGNLAARRDFSDVRDIVRAYVLLLEQGAPGEVYNLGAGRSYAIRELLDRLLAFAGVDCDIQIDPERYRPLTVPDVVCDASRARAACGWQPLISLDQTLAELLAYERGRLVEEQGFSTAESAENAEKTEKISAHSPGTSVRGRCANSAVEPDLPRSDHWLPH